ncbi:hypothetical protein SJA_C1-06970 [Sphingobium indicum UT26S]|uniref:Uncharacterized protein n=1 Tax=Sphingobium indicum (strain DSM 16413 / CCM 7287 / MTCC 6362 / UT26 / NBRC 101211 / UT26S) TaxID=452662 RepID=D4YYU9_SPHIU|nr:hypothetical protein SJA_C1-06970 [Sphingobium indicum UT26S]
MGRIRPGGEALDDPSCAHEGSARACHSLVSPGTRYPSDKPEAVDRVGRSRQATKRHFLPLALSSRQLKRTSPRMHLLHGGRNKSGHTFICSRAVAIG